MKALVISGGGSKRAFVGGVAQHLMSYKGWEYDMFLGTSTDSLVEPHLEANDIDKIYDIFIVSHNVEFNLYYTPTSFTENSLIFSKTLLTKWR